MRLVPGSPIPGNPVRTTVWASSRSQLCIHHLEHLGLLVGSGSPCWYFWISYGCPEPIKLISPACKDQESHLLRPYKEFIHPDWERKERQEKMRLELTSSRRPLPSYLRHKSAAILSHGHILTVLECLSSYSLTSSSTPWNFHLSTYVVCLLYFLPQCHNKSYAKYITILCKLIVLIIKTTRIIYAHYIGSPRGHLWKIKNKPPEISLYEY